MATVSVIVPGRATVQAPIVGQGSAAVQTQIFGRVEPALPSGSLQFNNAGYFGGSSSLTFDNPSTFLVLSGSGAAFAIHSTETSSENILSINSKGSNLLQVDGVNKKLTFNGTGFFDSLYIGGAEIASKAFVTGVSGYLNDKTNFLFSQVAVPTGVRSHFVSFGQTLSYTPRVIVELTTPLSAEEFYVATVDEIKTSGFDVAYSNTVANSGYILEYFASSKYFSV